MARRRRNRIKLPPWPIDCTWVRRRERGGLWFVEGHRLEMISARSWELRCSGARDPDDSDKWSLVYDRLVNLRDAVDELEVHLRTCDVRECTRAAAD